MRMLVLGAGLQGSACTYDLLRNPSVSQVVLADVRVGALPAFLTPFIGPRLEAIALDVRDADAVRAEMRAAGSDEAAIEKLVEHRVFPGDRPSTTIVLPRLESFTFGQLIALYEHKVAVLGALWDINPFDQWGVELGKQLANPLLAQLEERVVKPSQHDGSTTGLLREILKLRADG
jgi:hypothetical protein